MVDQAYFGQLQAMKGAVQLRSGTSRAQPPADDAPAALVSNTVVVFPANVLLDAEVLALVLSSPHSEVMPADLASAQGLEFVVAAEGRAGLLIGPGGRGLGSVLRH